MDSERRLELQESQLSWLPSIGLFVLFFLLMFWATQMSFDPANPKRLEQERINRANMQQFANKIEMRADKLGRKYKAKQCHSDLRKIALMDEKLGYPKNDGSMGMNCNYVSDPTVHNLIETCRFNMGCNSGFDAGTLEFRKEAVAFEKWQKANLRGRPDDRIVKLWKENGLQGLIHWVSVFYGRGIVLAISFFPLMMWRRMKGARRTIAENPVRYILACLFWPTYMWHYPYDVLHEAWLEVQIRRLGPLFRRLTQEEQTTIRQVASLERESYSAWIGDFQRRNEGLFARTAFAAMLGVIILHICCALIVLPTSCCADTRGSIAAVARAGPLLNSQDDHDGGSGFSHVPAEIMPVASNLPEPDLVIWGNIVDMVCRERQQWRKILHVPYYGWLIVGIITAIRSAGAILRHNGGNHAEHNKRNLCSNFAAFVNFGRARSEQSC